MRLVHSCLRSCRIASIVSTVHCLTPETMHTLREETTDVITHELFELNWVSKNGPMSNSENTSASGYMII